MLRSEVKKWETLAYLRNRENLPVGPGLPLSNSTLQRPEGCMDKHNVQPEREFEMRRE